MSSIQKNEAKALSPVDKLMLDLMGSMERRSARLENLLPPDMSVERFKESVRFALAQTPALLKCDPGSVLISVMKAAKMGIDVAGGALGHGALVPFGTECTFVPMYKGLVALAVVAGVVKDMTPVLVYDRDVFEVEEGDAPRLIHKPYVPRKATDGRGDIIAAYTRAILPDGTRVIKGLLYADDIARIESGAAKGGPWGSKHRPEMVKKSTVKNAFKTLGVPSSEQTQRLRAALDADVEAEARETDEPATHTLTPASGTDGLKATLKAKKQKDAVTMIDGDPEKVTAPVSHSLTDPDAEPPPGVRLPGEEG